MKLLLLLLAVAGLGGWYYYTQTTKSVEKTEQKKTIQTAAAVQANPPAEKVTAQKQSIPDTSAQEKQKNIEAAKAKLETALKEQSELENGRSNLKMEKERLETAIQSQDIVQLEKLLPENSPAKSRLQTMKDAFSKNKEQIKALSDEIDRLEKEKKKEETGLSAGRDSKKAIGWRWTTDSSNVIRPMSELPAQRNKPVRFIYGEKERNVNASELAKTISSKRTELEKLKQNEITMKNEAPKIKEACIDELNKLKEKIVQQIQESAKRSEEISEEVKSAEAIVKSQKDEVKI